MTSICFDVAEHRNDLDYSTVGLVPLFTDEYSDGSGDDGTSVSDDGRVGVNTTVLKQIEIELDEQQPPWMRYFPARMSKLAKENTTPTYGSSLNSAELTESDDLDYTLHSSRDGIPIVPFGMRRRTLSSSSHSSHGGSSHGKRSGKATRRHLGSTIRSTPYTGEGLKKSRTCFADLCSMASETTTASLVVNTTTSSDSNNGLMRSKNSLSSPDLLHRRANTAEVAMLFSFANLS